MLNQFLLVQQSDTLGLFLGLQQISQRDEP